MKIRLGFVSNSSSSSFYIYGANFKNGEDEAIEFFKKNRKDLPQGAGNEELEKGLEFSKAKLEVINKEIEKAVNSKALIEKEIQEAQDKIFNTDRATREDRRLFYGDKRELGLSNYCGEGNDYYIGVDLEDMDEDMTKRQFKAKVEEKLTKLFGNCDALLIGEHSESFYDG